MDSARLQPALLGGLLIGVLSALPIVQMGNCCCCLWIVTGGAIAAYLRQQNLPVMIAASEGALVGMMAGLIGGVLTTVLSIPMEMLMGPMNRRMIEWAANHPSFPQEMREAVRNAPMETTLAGGRIVLGFVVNVVAGVIFGLLGGLLGAAIFKKTPPPPPPGTVEVLPPA